MRWGGEDKLWWSPSNKGMVNVSSFYRVIACDNDIPFSFEEYSADQGALRVAFFASAALRKILTIDNLRK